MTDQFDEFETVSFDEGLAEVVPEIFEQDEEPPDAEPYLADCHECGKTVPIDLPAGRTPTPGAKTICDECFDVTEPPRSPLFEMAADISRVNAYAVTGDERYLKKNTEPNPKPLNRLADVAQRHETVYGTATAPAIDNTPWVPDAGGNGIDALPMFKPAIVEYGKTLTKDEILRITNEFRDALAKSTSELDAELTAIELIGESNWTAADATRAGEIRKIHKAIRADVEHRRKFLKEKALRTGQLIDSTANVGKGYCSKIEARAERVEKAEQIREQARRKKLADERTAELSPFVETAITFDLGIMPDDQYDILLTGSKAAHAARQQEIRDRERLDAERQARELREREAAAKKLARVNQLSALGYTFHAPSREYGIFDGHFCIEERAIETLSDEDWSHEFAALEESVAEYKRLAELDAKEAEEQARIDRENARIAKEQLEEIERQKAAKAREEAALALAPDKEKLEAYFRGVHDAVQPQPEVSSLEAKSVLDRFFNDVSNLVNAYAAEAGRL